ncbi:hypothetical protein [Mesorhizobium sp. WSM2561]|uniref:hypothetical protein n=1 Tax=Mesorhizobium sp. WSM2561 TaxID=1040985 RepID=UPI000480A471|nr:hypothetical protein [Mesorhizobium sp. WSM2561]
MQPFSGQTIQIQAIAQRGWRTHSDFRTELRPIPPQRQALFGGRTVTGRLRAGEFIAVASRTAEDAEGAVRHPSDAVAQSHFIMEKHAETLTPYENKGRTVLNGELMPQTRFTMGYIEDLLRPFGRSPADLKLMVCYLSSTGTEAETVAFVRTLANCLGGSLPPEESVEIWGVAQG